MDETKLTVRVPRHVLADAKEYAREHGTTLTRLVTTHLEHLRADEHPLRDAPITRRLAGSLPPEASVAEYRAHLEEKYKV
jgi:hypothetical protein